MPLPALGHQSDGPSMHWGVEPVLHVSVPVVVAGEGVATVHLVPVDSVVRIDNLVGGHPLVNVWSSLSHHSDPFPLDGAGHLDPLFAVIAAR